MLQIGTLKQEDIIINDYLNYHNDTGIDYYLFLFIILGNIGSINGRVHRKYNFNSVPHPDGLTKLQSSINEPDPPFLEEVFGLIVKSLKCY